MVRRWIVRSAALFVAILGAPALVWAVGGRTTGEVISPGVEIVDHQVGGLDREDLDRVFDAIDADLAVAPVTLAIGDTRHEVTSGDIGLSVDRDASAAAALDVGRTDTPLLRPWRWALGQVVARPVDLVLTGSVPGVEATMALIPDALTRPPIEPTIGWEEDRLVAAPGQAGEGVNPAALVESIRSEPVAKIDSLQFRAPLGAVPPSVSDERVSALVRQLIEATDGEIPVRLGPRGTTIPGAALRPHLGTEALDGQVAVTLAEAPILALLEQWFPDTIRQPEDAGIEIRNEKLVINAGATGLRCCAPESARALAIGLEDPRRGQITLPMVESRPEVSEEDVLALGIAEEIGSFTTNYPAGQTRVKNIHRIAELVDGQIIEPGGTFSLNERVGRRTRAKGFVSAGVIYLGTLTSDVGGGVSQFATTFFNAAFFGGLDFVEYQSHSLYFSRYPFGREATVSFPAPDLVVSNPSDHHILISTSVTETSVTVTLFSTPFARVTELGQSTRPQGQCRRVTTARERVWLDTGETDEDSVFALYRPGEGLNCAGALVQPPPAPTPPTAVTTPPPTGPTTTVVTPPPDPAPAPTSTTVAPSTPPSPTTTVIDPAPDPGGE